MVEDLRYRIVIKCYVEIFLKNNHIKGRPFGEVVVLKSEITSGNLLQ